MKNETIWVLAAVKGETKPTVPLSRLVGNSGSSIQHADLSGRPDMGARPRKRRDDELLSIGESISSLLNYGARLHER